MAWPIVQFNGQDYYQAQGINLVPVDGKGVSLVLLKEDGGILSGVTAVAQGDPGAPPGIDLVVNSTELAWDDPTPGSASWTQLSPPNETYPGGLYKYNHTWHAGQPGEDGDTVLDPDDFGTPVAGQILQVKSDLSAFELVAQKITEVFFPGTVNNTASGNANSTLATISIPSRPYARRVRGFGHTVVTGEGTDVRVDLIARLNGESGGNIVGRCHGIAQTERLQLSPGKAAGTADAYDTISAGASATVYMRCERQAGSVTYTTSATTSLFSVEVSPL